MTERKSRPSIEWQRGGERFQERLNGLDARLSRLENESAAPSGTPLRSRVLQEIFRARRRRAELFGSQILGEPAWEIILELYAAELGRQRLLVSKVGQASGISQSTALRWMHRLEAEGWIGREPDPHRGRRIFAVLTPQASVAMHTYVNDLLSRQLIV